LAKQVSSPAGASGGARRLLREEAGAPDNGSKGPGLHRPPVLEKGHLLRVGKLPGAARAPRAVCLRRLRRRGLEKRARPAAACGAARRGARGALRGGERALLVEEALERVEGAEAELLARVAAPKEIQLPKRLFGAPPRGVTGVRGTAGLRAGTRVAGRRGGGRGGAARTRSERSAKVRGEGRGVSN